MVRNALVEGNPCGASVANFVASLCCHSWSCLAIATPAVYTHVDQSLNQILAEFHYSTAAFS